MAELIIRPTNTNAMLACQFSQHITDLASSQGCSLIPFFRSRLRRFQMSNPFGDMPRRVPRMPTGNLLRDDLTNIQFIQRAFHTLSSLVQDMRVNHRRTDIGMTEQFLNGPNVVAILNRMRRKRMSKGT